MIFCLKFYIHILLKLIYLLEKDSELAGFEMLHTAILFNIFGAFCGNHHMKIQCQIITVRKICKHFCITTSARYN